MNPLKTTSTKHLLLMLAALVIGLAYGATLARKLKSAFLPPPAQGVVFDLDE